MAPGLSYPLYLEVMDLVCGGHLARRPGRGRARSVTLRLYTSLKPIYKESPNVVV